VQQRIQWWTKIAILHMTDVQSVANGDAWYTEIGLGQCDIR